MISKLRLGFKLGALAAVLLAGAASPARAEDVLTISSPTATLAQLPYHVAQAMGYFQQVGLRVDFTFASTGPASIAAAVTGDRDLVIGGPSTQAFARRAGGDIIIFAALATQYGVNVIVSQKWADAHNLKVGMPYKDKILGLKGATIGVTSPGGGNDQLVRYLAGKYGMNADRDMTIVSMGESAAQMAGYAAGRVDALAASPPTSNQAVRTFGGIMLLNLGIGEIDEFNGYFGSSIAASGAWLKKNPDQAARVVKALQMAFDAMHDPARTNQARDATNKARFPDIDPDLWKELWVDQVKGAPKSPEITPDMMRHVLEFSNQFSKDKIDTSQVAIFYSNEPLERMRAGK